MSPKNKFIPIVSQNGKKAELISLSHLLATLPNSAFVLCKDKNFTYQSCNKLVLNLTGCRSPAEIIGKRASQLNIRKESIESCERAQQIVLETLTALETRLPIYFENNNPCFELNAKIFPIMDHLEEAIGVLSVSTCQMLFPDNIHSFFEMIKKEKINQLVKNKEYIITLKGHEINLTKREVVYLLYLMKGRFAKEIASAMSICTRTIEDYMQVLKIKMGCYSKSDLISLAFESDLLKILQRSLSDYSKINIKGE